ncbi:hypothetical protein AKJ16_DCAP10603 [Drosera capensis]
MFSLFDCTLTLPTPPLSLSFSLHRHGSAAFPLPLHLRRCRLKPPNSYPSPFSDDPPEAPEDTSHGVSKFHQIQRQANKARRLQEEDFEKHKSVYLDAIRDLHDAPDDEPAALDSDRGYEDDAEFGGIDRALAVKRKEFVKQGLLEPNPPPKQEEEEELGEEELGDLEEIEALDGIRAKAKAAKAADDDENDDEDDVKVGDEDKGGDEDDDDILLGLEEEKIRIVEPKFKMTLAELLDECKVVPVSVYGDLEVEISGIQHDSRMVSSGDLFVCCFLKEENGDGGKVYLTEADKRGAVAVVASVEVDIEESLACKALVILEDTNAALPKLAASFYRYPTQDMSVIGVAGTEGRTTIAYLIKGMYEAMGLRAGVLSSVAYYVHGNNKLESTDNTVPELDSVSVQKVMATMLHNGSEAVVMETSVRELSLGRCEELDFDIAVFTDLIVDRDADPAASEEQYRGAYAKLFSKMVDPERHRKVVNIDDPNAAFFVAQGNINVPVVTFAIENKKADVHALKFELSLFETMVLVNTPQGILEISSGLLGRHNIYNILAAVAVGIAVGAPLEEIVRGIEEVDAVPGRCELIDEEQTFGVVVDHAKTPSALSRLLDSMRELKPKRIITVVGCCGERERGKRPLMTKIATDKSDVTLLTSDNPAHEDPLDILDDMLAGVGWTMQDYLKHGQNDYYPPLKNGHRLFLHDVRRVAVRAAVAMGEEGDMVVVTGKGHDMYEIEGDKRNFLDDREECREALQSVHELHRAGIDTSEFPWRLPESH